MPLELSLPVKIAALAGLVLAAAGGAFLLIAGRHHAASASIPVAPPVHHARAHAAAASAHRSRAPLSRQAARPTSNPSLPAPLRQALARHGLVVAVLESPGIPIDAAELTAARRGAAATHAGLAVLDVADEKTAEAVASSFPNASDPALLIVRRPGTVVTELDGVEDAQTVTQAVLDARRR